MPGFIIHSPYTTSVNIVIILAVISLLIAEDLVMAVYLSLLTGALARSSQPSSRGSLPWPPWV